MNTYDRTRAQNLVDEYAGKRLDAVGTIPGLKDATADLVVRTLGSAESASLLQTQFRQLCSPAGQAIPDAYLATEAAVEDSLQGAAAGLRTAMARNGHIVDGRVFERGLAQQLTDDPRFAIRAELARIARPLTRPEVLRRTIPPVPWIDESGEDTPWPPTGYTGDNDTRSIPGGADALARVEDGGHAGWVQIGLLERQETPPRRYPKLPARSITVGVGLEAGSPPPTEALPFAGSSWTTWTSSWDRLVHSTSPQAAARAIGADHGPMVAIVDHGSGRRGAGEPLFTLVPVLILVVALELRPTPGLCGFSLSDGRGPALVGRQWRGHPVHDGNYRPTFPAVHGTDLIVRPDTFECLSELIGKVRCRAGLYVSCNESDENADEGELDG